MRPRLVVGPLLGVRVVVTLSWLIVLAIVVFALEAMGIFSPDIPLPARLLLGAVVGVLFLASLAVHEIAHALAARRQGLAVNEVGLAVIGTQGELEQRAPTGRGEMTIALAGPLVSLVLGGLFAVLSLTVGVTTDPWLLALANISWLVGLSNLLVGGVNLLPGFPFDGGRLLRGIVMTRTGDADRGTRFALLAGRLLAYGMIGLGIALTVSGRFIDGIWLVVLGWLLIQSNRLHQRRTDIEQLVHGLRVSDVMDERFAVVLPNLTVDALLAQHQQHESGSSTYPVAQLGALVGVVDIGQVLRLSEARRLETRVEDVMTEVDKLAVLTAPTSVMDALQSFDRTRLDALPVVDERSPRTIVGMLTREGLINALRARRSARQAAGQPR